MTYQEFIGEPENRQRYWARNHIGWSHLRRADPNDGHAAVARLEQRGPAHRAHHPKRGPSPRGRRQCQRGGPARPLRPGGLPGLPPPRTAARLLAGVLEELNPGFLERALAAGAVEMAPDADATVEDSDLIARFVVARLSGLRRNPQAGLRVLR